MYGFTVTQMYVQNGILVVVDRDYNNHVELMDSLATQQLRSSVPDTQVLLTDQFAKQSQKDIQQMRDFVESASRQAEVKRLVERKVAAENAARVASEMMSVAKTEVQSSAETQVIAEVQQEVASKASAQASAEVAASVDLQAVLSADSSSLYDAASTDASLGSMLDVTV